ncbi:hypothetical protein ACFYZ8_34230 [Streptomyces sp. NPDC001668]|uniref:hypothetical protein n=1 Tax=Streptomyces sp. NPDC001668 TaxID=3364598 RepID=UPI0036A08F8E
MHWLGFILGDLTVVVGGLLVAGGSFLALLRPLEQTLSNLICGNLFVVLGLLGRALVPGADHQALPAWTSWAIAALVGCMDVIWVRTLWRLRTASAARPHPPVDPAS